MIHVWTGGCFSTDAKAIKSTRLVLTRTGQNRLLENLCNKIKLLFSCFRTADSEALTSIGLAQLHLNLVVYWNRQYLEYTGLLVSKCDWVVSAPLQVGTMCPGMPGDIIPSSEPNTIHRDSRTTRNHEILI